MSQNQRRIWSWIPWALLSGLLVVLAFRGQNLSALLAQILDASWTWMSLSLLLSILGLIFRTARWQLLLKAAGQATRFWPTFVALQLGYLSNLALPRMGEITRCGSLYKMTGVSALAAGGTVLAERVVDLACLALLSLTALLLAGEKLKLELQESLLAPLKNKLGNHQLELVLILLAGLLLLASIVWFWRRQGKGGKFKQMLNSLIEGGMSIFRLEHKALFLLYTLGIWLLYASAPICALMAMNIGKGQVLELGFFAFIVGSLARTLPLPGGSAGAYHLAVGQVLLAYGQDAQSALGLASLNHLAQTLLQLGLGLAAAIAFTRISSKAQGYT